MHQDQALIKTNLQEIFFMKKNIGCIMGTRPEVIKMAPLIKVLQNDPDFSVTVICSAQHRTLLDDMLAVFHIAPDVDLNIMKENQSLSELTGNLCAAFEKVAKEKHYDAWLVQGDTTTTFIASLIAFYHKIPIGHVEAGLRTGDCYEPFPEEINRVLTSHLAKWHFVPTEIDRDNLLKEGIADQAIYVTGNTVIDALYSIIDKNMHVHLDQKKIILVTVHRRESFGEPLIHIFQALKKIAVTFPDVEIVYPVHPNPNVKNTAEKLLSGLKNLHLIPPLNYTEFCILMQKSYLVLTDSGGIQEEAPALGKPVLVLRDKTERPLVISVGAGKLVGTETNAIFSAAELLLTDKNSYQSMVKEKSPYGDGDAAKRIVAILRESLIR